MMHKFLSNFFLSQTQAVVLLEYFELLFIFCMFAASTTFLTIAVVTYTPAFANSTIIVEYNVPYACTGIHFIIFYCKFLELFS
jgi:hypothetical protein